LRTYPELDLAELLYEMEDELEIKIPLEDMKRMDGTFDAIVRYVALQRHPA
jgi:acyl carrier protein